MIQELYINNFKSLHNCRIQLSKLTCLIGLNNTGKTTLIQAIDFIAQLAKGDIKEWLETRQWQLPDLLSHLKPPSNILFELKLQLKEAHYIWTGEFDINRLNCCDEKISNQTSGETLFEVTHHSYRIKGQPKKKLEFKYQGSALSALLEEALTKELAQIRAFLTSIKSIELLSPQLMQKRTLSSVQELGLGGDNLSAFFHNLSNNKKTELNRHIKEIFSPTFEAIATTTTPSNHKLLFIEENFSGTHRIKTEAKHISDGLLRILALCSQTLTTHTVLLFDEIEDGINPEWVESLVDLLVESPKKILMTTHSPMVLNYLEDEQAKESVIFTYKDKQGATQHCRFFSIAGVRKKLEILGPGEAMVDVSEFKPTSGRIVS
jgi:predicted ATPase